MPSLIAAKRVLIIFILLLIFTFFSLRSLGAVMDSSETASGDESLTSGGDSIFHEIMVDMTWRAVEKAAKVGAIVLMTTAVIEEHGPHKK